MLVIVDASCQCVTCDLAFKHLLGLTIIIDVLGPLSGFHGVWTMMMLCFFGVLMTHKWFVYDHCQILNDVHP